MDATYFDADTFVAFADLARQYIVAGFGTTLSFWMVAHVFGRLISVFRG